MQDERAFIRTDVRHLPFRFDGMKGRATRPGGAAGPVRPEEARAAEGAAGGPIGPESIQRASELKDPFPGVFDHPPFTEIRNTDEKGINRWFPRGFLTIPHFRKYGILTEKGSIDGFLEGF